MSKSYTISYPTIDSIGIENWMREKEVRKYQNYILMKNDALHRRFESTFIKVF
jgi:hypothetical protein